MISARLGPRTNALAFKVVARTHGSAPRYRPRTRVRGLPARVCISKLFFPATAPRPGACAETDPRFP